MRDGDDDGLLALLRNRRTRARELARVGRGSVLPHGERYDAGVPAITEPTLRWTVNVPVVHLQTILASSLGLVVIGLSATSVKGRSKPELVACLLDERSGDVRAVLPLGRARSWMDRLVAVFVTGDVVAFLERADSPRAGVHEVAAGALRAHDLVSGAPVWETESCTLEHLRAFARDPRTPASASGGESGAIDPWNERNAGGWDADAEHVAPRGVARRTRVEGRVVRWWPTPAGPIAYSTLVGDRTRTFVVERASGKSAELPVAASAVAFARSTAYAFDADAPHVAAFGADGGKRWSLPVPRPTGEPTILALPWVVVGATDAEAPASVQVFAIEGSPAESWLDHH